MEYKGYSARVEFDADAGVLVGEVEGLRDVVTFEATNVRDLEKAFHESVDDYLGMCAERGEEPEKPYSGRFLVRVDPKLHRDIALAAARAGKSLNAFAGEAFKRWIDAYMTPSAKSVSPPSRVVREAKANASSQTEKELELFSTEAPGVVAESEENAAVWARPGNRTPGVTTPARTPSTPAGQATPQPNTPADLAA